MITSKPLPKDNSDLFLVLKNKMIEIYGATYFSFHDKDVNDFRKYCPVKSSVARMILVGLYKNSIDLKEIPAIEDIPQETKNKYWEYAKQVSTEKEIRMNICTAMYVMDYITGTI